MTVPAEPQCLRELLVNEIFGPTFQGEGPSTGQQATFVRLSHCNLTCTWCDTRYSWDWEHFDIKVESRRVSVDEVAASVLAHPVPLVVVTGGEPLIQTEPLIDLVGRLVAAGRRVEIETNGTIVPDTRLVALVDRFNVSPKLANAGVALAKRVKPEALAAFVASGKAVFKFVLAGMRDAQHVAAMAEEFGLAPVWVMPEGTTPPMILAGMRNLAEEALQRGWNLSPRLHVLLWGDQRGR
jgi:7-cyano-7-deazaguanosine (preQ0) biosynthesis protein QueE